MACLFLNDDPDHCHQFWRTEDNVWAAGEYWWVWNECEDFDYDQLYECYEDDFGYHHLEEGVWYQYSDDKAFAFVYETMNWYEAGAACTYLGGNLASVADEDQDEWVMWHLYELDFSDAWIGMHDISSEGTQVWSDGTPVEYTNYHDGQPDDWGGNEDCMTLAWFAWNDLDCNTDWVSRFVCSMHTTGADTDHTYKDWSNMERKDWDAYWRELEYANCPWMFWKEGMDEGVQLFHHDECGVTAGAEDNWTDDESGRWSAFNDWNELCLYLNNDPDFCHKFERVEKHVWT